MTTDSPPPAFTYPSEPIQRHNGPSGYKDYSSYRPWLRDDFKFRCIYCLVRETWGRVSGEFDLDHFVPQVQAPDQATDYENLVYACHTCNLRKAQRTLPDAMAAFTSTTIRISPDGAIHGTTDEAKRIIRLMSLNSEKMKRWRQMWMRIVELAERHDADHYRQLMGYPDDLPDLSRCDPPTNTKPEGIDKSHFARRQRGELENTFLS